MNNFYGVLKCTGPDAKRFLQGQLSCDMEKITPELGGMGAYCNLKGRVIALFFVIACEEGYFLVLPKDLISGVLEKLTKFIAFSKAQLIDASDEYHVYTFIGDKPDTKSAFHATSLPECKGLVGVSKVPDLNLENEADEKTWSKYLIEHKIPTISSNESEKFLPHYINLIDLNAVSFDKGCFVGQEVIARMHYRGNLKKQLAYEFVEGELKPETGVVVNSISIGGKTYALVVESMQSA